MTPLELKLYKESVIREYKFQKEERQKKNRTINVIMYRLRSLVPLNIAIGVIASIVLISMDGWNALLKVFLTSVIWITLTSTIIAAIVGKK